jgi:hypothetical protein
MSKILLLIVFFCFSSVLLLTAVQCAPRLRSFKKDSASPPGPSSVLIMLDGNSFSTSESVSLACLQGTLAQAQAMLYLLPPGEGRSLLRSKGQFASSGKFVAPDTTRALYRDYLDGISKVHKVTVLTPPTATNDSFVDAVSFIQKTVQSMWQNTSFKEDLTWQYVRTNGSSPDSVAVGVMTCAQNGPGCLLASDARQLAALQALGFGEAASTVTKTIREYLMVDDGVRLSSKELAILQDPTKFPALVDVVAATGGSMWFDTLQDIDLSIAVLSHLAAPSVVLGWGVDEDDTVQMLSEFTSGIIAADWALNTATLSSYPMPSKKCPFTPRPPEGETTADEESDNRHVVAFVMTDGDNVQWLLNGFLEPAWFGSHDRGKSPISWTMSPSLAWISPVTYSLIMNSATINDSFIGSVSGYSYNYPSLIPSWNLAASVNLSQTALEDLGLSVINILDQPSTLLPAEKIATNFALGSERLKTVLYYPYEFYCALNGAMSVSPDRSTVFASGRFCLWSPQFYNVSSLVAELQKQPQDPTIVQGYSVVPVNVWSHNTSDVWAVAQQLDAAKFRVVGIEELAEIARKRLGGK